MNIYYPFKLLKMWYSPINTAGKFFFPGETCKFRLLFFNEYKLLPWEIILLPTKNKTAEEIL
jgi:hypothetical protein